MLNPRLSTLLEFEPQRWPGAPAGRDNMMIQVPHTLVTNLKRTVTIPDGQTAMYCVYPVRHPTKPSATQPAEPPHGPAIMLFKPTVVVTRETDPKTFPLLSTRVSDGERPTTSRPLDSTP
jgi:hypothetical protein